jgi:hypothetical protein
MKVLLGSALAFSGCGQATRRPTDKPIDLSVKTKNKMDIVKGFQIDNPKVFIPWV